MSSLEENKLLIRFCVDEALNKGNLSVADEHFASDYLVHIPSRPDPGRGPGVFKDVIGMWRSAFADWHMTIEDLVADGDLVANRFTTTGTHTGPLMGIPPTGRRMVVRGQELHRIASGKVAESWICDDVPSILAQVGVLVRSGGPAGDPAT